jgi:hypothetical protein
VGLKLPERALLPSRQPVQVLYMAGSGLLRHAVVEAEADGRLRVRFVRCGAVKNEARARFLRFDPELVDAEWSDLSIEHLVDEGPAAADPAWGDDEGRPLQQSSLLMGRRRQRGRSTFDRAAGLARACQEMDEQQGGQEGTRETHATNRRIWIEAMTELREPPEVWFEFDATRFRRFGGWMLENLDYQSIKEWVTMLNNERQNIFEDCARPWARHPLILKSRKAYEVLMARRREMVRVSRLLAGLRPIVKRRRVCPPGHTVRTMLETAEAAVLLDGSGQNIIGPVSSFFLSALFAVRASTLGAMESPDDVSIDAAGIGLVIRFVKMWTANRQPRTQRPLPVTRSGVDGVP